MLCLLCGATGGANAQRKAEVFDPAWSLEETVAWLGKQLGHSWTEVSSDGKLRRRFSTRVIEAKGCALVYVRETQSDSTASASATTPASQEREVWTLDISGLDPLTVGATRQGRVLFRSAGTKRDVIRTSVFRQWETHPNHLTTRHNRSWGAFTVDEKRAAALADALRHAVALCRERRK